MPPETAVDAARSAARWFESDTEEIHPILDAIGSARPVLIGEASHGTHEFYRIRADVTKALIERHGFNIVAVEADWPDAYRANRWVRHRSADPDAVSALDDFTRFPRWMWRNDVVVDFLAWLRDVNATREAHEQAGFYGLDLYSLHSSMERASHCFRARLPDQFDVVVHVDRTQALTPLERWAREEADVPETYPTGVR